MSQAGVNVVGFVVGFFPIGSSIEC